MNMYYRSIPSEEMSDFEEFYRWIAHNLPPDAYVAELGVAEGRGVILMASLMAYMRKPCTIWAVDNFSYGADLQRETFYRNIKNSGESSIQPMDMDTLVAATRCQDSQFDFVFIDSSHLYEHTRAEIMLWWHKVKVGGILAGHDYNGLEEVKKAVDEMFDPALTKIFETSNAHGVWWVEKIAGLKLLK